MKKWTFEIKVCTRIAIKLMRKPEERKVITCTLRYVNRRTLDPLRIKVYLGAYRLIVIIIWIVLVIVKLCFNS